MKMRSLGPDETELHGGSVSIDKRLVGDPVSVRISHLISSELIEVATADGGWSTLCLDPVDGRYWELTYLHSDMHGGGPRSLIQLDCESAKLKYDVA